MHRVDMSPEAITTRLKRVAQLRRLGLSLKKAGINTEVEKPEEERKKDSAQQRDQTKSE